MARRFLSWRQRDKSYISAVGDTAEGLVAAVMDISQSRPRLLNYAQDASATLSPLDLQGLAQGLTPHQTPWVWTTSREQYNLLVLDKPPVPASELDKGIRWALDSRIDFPSEEAAVVWMDIPLPADAVRPEHIYAVATHQSTIDNLSQIFKEAALPLKVVDVRETAQRNIAALLEKKDECLALMSFERRGVLLTFTWRGELYLDRFLAQPLEEIKQADENQQHYIVERIVNHYTRSLDFLSRQFAFLQVNRLVLGPQPFALDMISALSPRLPHPLQPLDLRQVLTLGEQIDEAAFADPRLQAQLWCAIGAGLRYEGRRS